MTTRLLQVGTHEAVAKRFFDQDDIPEWLGSETNEGAFEFRPWAEDQIMVLLSVRMAGEQHAVRVAIAALYELGEGGRAPAEEHEFRSFYRQHMPELMPFLRQAVHATSSLVWPVKPIMLDVLASSPEESATRRQRLT